ncbi:DUF4382 domain-containing protein [Flavihumibacter rivuli]|uniref:DUF4382 domain-containing protein n=1 Tax=Flavihumibacter rivuli TaxID=2838156 RepID=UPI001BDED7E7|nr:DUF4382 domain-containing protein [Flavihumibacter rivuli]ULQ56866.1 DUF4382 domain-containing protein [Flavihumibacter rivuli]
MKTKHLFACAVLSLAALAFTSCSDNNNTGPDQARLEVRLTDAPNPNIKEVWVDIREIQINTGDTSKWMSLQGIYPGIYNLLELTNGKDTLLADAVIPAGRISQLRLILGSNNYIIMKDGRKEMLSTPSAQQSGLKVQIQSEVSGGVLYRLVLDFDAAKSVVEAGNSGKFNLKPVIRVISFIPSGGIAKGVVAPDTVLTNIYAIKGSDTIASTATDSGRYQFRDIPAGAYAFHYYPTDTTFKSTTRNVSITLGQTTVIDTVKLEKK